MRNLILLNLVCVLAISSSAIAAEPVTDLWPLSREKMSIHRFSTLIPAREVRDYLSTEKGIDAAIDFCKRTGITKIYLEEFRDGYQAERETIVHARDRNARLQRPPMGRHAAI